MEIVSEDPDIHLFPQQEQKWLEEWKKSKFAKMRFM